MYPACGLCSAVDVQRYLLHFYIVAGAGVNLRGENQEKKPLLPALLSLTIH